MPASIVELPENLRSRDLVLKSIGHVFADEPATGARLTDRANTSVSAGDNAPVAAVERARRRH